MINKEINVNGIIYSFKEVFDVNLTLAYENDTWTEWHICREFISNALDAVENNIEKVQIYEENGFINIHDFGGGYPIVYAKRIGSSSKRNEPSSVGQFGEGIKLSMLTCLRNDIEVMMGSQNWLIIPKSIDVDGQSVLMYDIFESDESIEGSLIIIESTSKIKSIIENLRYYFLQYNNEASIFGDSLNGIFPTHEGKSLLYNKGVFVKSIEGLYSYALSIEKLNRDRDLLNISDVAYEVSSLWEKVKNKEPIKNLISASVLPYPQRNKPIEFYSVLYSRYPEVWAEAFKEMYGVNACIFTDSIAAREAECLNYVPISNIESDVIRILESGGIKKDVDCIAEDYEFVWSTELTKEEKTILKKLPQYAKIAGFKDLPEVVKVFSEYRNHENINGCYNNQNQQVYLKKEILDGGLEKALKTYLHEACHHETGADDLDRNFAGRLCKLLASLLIKYVNEIGSEIILEISNKGLALPNNIPLSVNELTAEISMISNEFTIKVSENIFRGSLFEAVDKPIVMKRKIILYKNNFIISIPESIIISFGNGSVKCRLK